MNDKFPVKSSNNIMNEVKGLNIRYTFEDKPPIDEV
jgi:hypothetical protein